MVLCERTMVVPIGSPLWPIALSLNIRPRFAILGKLRLRRSNQRGPGGGQFGEEFWVERGDWCKPDFNAVWERRGAVVCKRKRVVVFCRLSTMHELDRQTDRWCRLKMKICLVNNWSSYWLFRNTKSLTFGLLLRIRCVSTNTKLVKRRTMLPLRHRVTWSTQRFPQRHRHPQPLRRPRDLRPGGHRHPLRHSMHPASQWQLCRRSLTPSKRPPTRRLRPLTTIEVWPRPDSDQHLLWRLPTNNRDCLTSPR